MGEAMSDLFFLVVGIIIAAIYNGPHVKTNPEKIIVNQIIPY